MKPLTGICSLLATLVSLSELRADEYYVSASRGKGKQGSKAEPVADLGVLAPNLKAGDTVYIAAGVYLGRLESGVDEIKVPVKILGGFSDDFAKRDPWGEFKTILSGKNKAEGFQSGPRLAVGDRRSKGTGTAEIVLDGLIVDHGDRNSYSGEGESTISRMSNPKSGKNASPNRPGIAVDATGVGRVTVENCVLLNCAPHHTQGALQVFGGKATKIAIRNNLILNNTGSGIGCTQSVRGKELPQFALENNTVLFTWAYGPLEGGCGSAVRVDSFVEVRMVGNVFAHTDYAGIDNPSGGKIADLSGNLFHDTRYGPYAERKKRVTLKQIDSETKDVATAKENAEEKFDAAVPEEWMKNYLGRPTAGRSETDDKGDTEEPPPDAPQDVFLHRLALDGALKCGEAKILGKYGCEKPKAR